MVGVNTFGRLDPETLTRINFALDGADLLAYLEGLGIEAARDGDACGPAVASLPAAPPTPIEAAPPEPGDGDPAAPVTPEP